MASKIEDPLPKTVEGSAGETHQVAGGDHPVLTTANGIPVSDDQNTLRVGLRGPSLLEDFHFREKIFHFDHERIPERVVHARGFGAHGSFETLESLADITRADIFQRAGEKTEAFVRFSTVAGNKGSADLARDVRGFAVKLYTQEGNWDLVGNNIPVFFIQDAIKFPDLIHAAKQEPDRGFPQAQTAHDNFWDFISLTPELINMALWIMSDRTIPRSFRFMEGFGVHTFRFVNARRQVDLRQVPLEAEARPAVGRLERGGQAQRRRPRLPPPRPLGPRSSPATIPQWDFGVQLFDEDFAEQLPLRRPRRDQDHPRGGRAVRIVGRLTLDRCVDNFFAETEQVAFQTGNIVPGIDFTNDPLLQGRNFSYLDTQLKRLGSHQLHPPAGQRPALPVPPLPAGRPHGLPQSDRPRQLRAELLGSPGRPARGSRRAASARFPAEETGPKLRGRGELFADHYSQARQFYLSQTAGRADPHPQRLRLRALQGRDARRSAPASSRTCATSTRTSPPPSPTASGCDLPTAAKPARPVVTDLKPSSALSIIANGPQRFEGRKLGILVTDGADAAAARGAQGGDAGGGRDGRTRRPEGRRRHPQRRHASLPADHRIDGGPSVLFDAVAILPSADGAALLANEAAARDFVADAYAHAKFIAVGAAAGPLLEKAGVEKDNGIFALDGKDVDAFVQACGQLRFWEREAKVHV